MVTVDTLMLATLRSLKEVMPRGLRSAGMARSEGAAHTQSLSPSVAFPFLSL